MSLYEWKIQLGQDKRLYEQAKAHKKRLQRRGFGLDTVARMVGYYGKNYRESLNGYKRALKRSKKPKTFVKPHYRRR